MPEFTRIAAVGEVPPGGRKLAFLDDQPVAVFNVEGQFHCIGDVCTHDGGPLAEGELQGHEIECPRHGARFDVRTGAALSFPATEPAPVYRLKVEGDHILVARP